MEVMMSIRKVGTGEVLSPIPTEPQQGIEATASQEQPWTPQDEQELAVESRED
jgi:hypothetical protein